LLKKLRMFVTTNIFFILRSSYMSRNRIVFLSIFCLYFIVVLFTRKPDFFSGKLTHGKVVRIAEKVVPTDNLNPIIYVPDVEFIVGGETYTAMDYDAIWPPIYKEGDSVRVIYDPENPRNCYIFSMIGYWINMSELMIAGIILTIIGAIYLALKKNTSPFADTK